MDSLLNHLKSLTQPSSQNPIAADSLVTYVQDHLAGARFAVTLLQDLSKQNVDSDVAHFAVDLRSEIEADRQVLEQFLTRLGPSTHSWKEIASWVAQKASQLKLNLHTALGIFEAIEFLALGVQGKLALWKALEVARNEDVRISELDFNALIARAQTQYQELESWRLKLALKALANKKS